MGAWLQRQQQDHCLLLIQTYYFYESKSRTTSTHSLEIQGLSKCSLQPELVMVVGGGSGGSKGSQEET